MKDPTYSEESATYVDKTGRSIQHHAGEVVFTFEGAFNWAIILGFAQIGEDWYAKVVRPYAYASSVGTTAPNVLLGVETYTVNIRSLKRERERPDIRITERTV